jgi:hypothetical protein
MSIARMPEPIDALVITDTFSPVELENIMNEINVLSKNDDGSGVWINDVYKDPEVSIIHQNIMERFFNFSVVGSLVELNPLYGTYSHINNHSTVVRYLGHEQMIGMHEDAAVYTIMTFLYNEPKNFEGGNVTLQFNDVAAYEQDIENNMSIIFPSSFFVGISDLTIKDKEIANSGLYTLNTFLFVESR